MTSLKPLSLRLTALILFTLTFSFSACGLKKREVGTGSQPIVGGDLPSGATYTKNRQFLIRLSTEKLMVDEAFKVTYNLATLEIIPPDEKNFSVEIMYWMPEMPAMGQFHTTGNLLSAGRYEATYDISMAGLWEVQMTFKLNGSPVDQFTYSYNVEE